MIFRYFCLLQALTSNPAANALMFMHNLKGFLGEMVTGNSCHRMCQTRGNLDEECDHSPSLPTLTTGPDYFPGSDISQSVAHYCNRAGYFRGSV